MKKVAAVTPTTQKVGHYRHFLALVLFLTAVVAFLDRTNLSVLIADDGFLGDMGIRGQPAAQGMLMTAFLVPYALANLLMGPLGDWLGARSAMAVAVTVWGLASALMGSAASYPLLLMGRVLRGAAEGPLFPMMSRFVKNWFPPHERGGANAIWLLGSKVGPAFTVPLLLWVISSWGWQASLYGQALLCFLVIVPLLWLMTTDRPHQNRFVGAAEAAYIEAGQEKEAVATSSWGEAARVFIGNYYYWLCMGFHACQLVFYNGLVTWLPKYLAEARGFDLAQMGFFTSLAYFLSAVSNALFGFASDRFPRRAPFCAVALFGAAVCLGPAPWVDNRFVSAVLLAAGMGFWGISPPIYWAILQRIVPGRVIGTASGLDNGLANSVASLTPALIGYLIAATGSYQAGLMLLAGAALVGGLFMAILAMKRY